MLPVVAGRAATTWQILIYCALLSAASVLPWVLGFAGPIYGAAAIACGANLVMLAVRLRRSDEADRRAPRRLFAFSIFHLFALFAALLIDHADQPLRSTLASSSRADAGAALAVTLPRAIQAAGTSITTGTDEV
jgi:protoheme IX farnesyltransferase